MDKIATKEALQQVAEALNDKIAQQDYIELPRPLDIGNLTEGEKNLIRKHIKAGNILNCVFVYNDSSERNVCRIIGYSYNYDSDYFALSVVDGGKNVLLQITSSGVA